MGTFVPGTADEQQAMLRDTGYQDWEDMLSAVPEEVRLRKALDLPEGMSEMEASRVMQDLAEKNKRYRVIFRGAGAYDHYIPSIVRRVTSKETFLTAYTPYQAEISQGVLQSIFEYQSMICDLTGMDVANASVYDGAVAAAEGVMLCLDRHQTKILVSGAVNPQVLSVIRTYAFGRDADVTVIPVKDGATDQEALHKALGAGAAACLLIQQPNYFGVLEDVGAMEKMVHEAGAKLVMSVNPISLGLLKTPGEYGADLAVGEGQPLGMPLSYGGPYLGFMASTSALMRRLPGRMVGETTDSQGRRAFVLTLQAREQHIKREKASSNICSNEALCALTASVYLSAMGPDGLKEAASQCCSKAHYLEKGLEEAGYTLAYDQPFFHEFVMKGPGSQRLLARLDEQGILGGLALSGDEILWCCTEKNTRAQMDEVIRLAKEVR